MTDNREGTKLINDSKSYIGDKHIAKKEFARKIDLSCTVAHPYDGTEEEWEKESKKCIFSKFTPINMIWKATIQNHNIISLIIISIY